MDGATDGIAIFVYLDTPAQMVYLDPIAAALAEFTNGFARLA